MNIVFFASFAFLLASVCCSEQYSTELEVNPHESSHSSLVASAPLSKGHFSRDDMVEAVKLGDLPKIREYAAKSCILRRIALKCSIDLDDVDSFRAAYQLGFSKRILVSEAKELLNVACKFGSLSVINFLALQIRPDTETWAKCFGHAVYHEHQEVAKVIARNNLMQNRDQAFSILLKHGNVRSIRSFAALSGVNLYTTFESLVELAIKTEDEVRIMAEICLDCLLRAFPKVGKGFNGPSFFHAAVQNGYVRLAQLLLSSGERGSVYLEPFIATNNVPLAHSFIAQIITDATIFTQCLEIAAKAQKSEAFSYILDWTVHNRPALVVSDQVIKCLGRVIDHAIIRRDGPVLFGFLEVLFRFKPSEISLHEKAEMILASGYSKAGSLVQCLKLFLSLKEMAKEDDFWLPNDLLKMIAIMNLDI